MDTSHPLPPISQSLPTNSPSGKPTLQSLTDLHPTEESYPIIVVRALYPYQSNDSATISLSFNKDDLIQVVAQLETGWWYGFCNDSQGWFPSNFVEEITQEDLDDSDSQDEETSNDDWWIPQTGSDNQVYYFNPRTKESSWTLPTPSSNKAPSASTSSVASLSSSSIPASIPASTTALASASESASNSALLISSSNNSTTTTSTTTATITGPTSAAINLDTQSANSSTLSLQNILHRSDSVSTDGLSSTATGQLLARNPSLGSARSSLTGGPLETHGGLSEQSLDTPRAMTTFAQDGAEIDNRDESTRPNSWQASAIPTRAGSPILQDNLPSHLAAIRKPSNSSSVSGFSSDRIEGLPPLPPLSNPFESDPTWDSLSNHISSSIQNLLYSAAHGYKPYYQIQAAQVVESVRVMLYASGTIDKDSTPIKTNLDLKIYHRQVMAALSRLVLSAKMASSTWPADGALMKMRSNADDVANAINQFICTARAAGVTVNDVDAKLILDPEGGESKASSKLSRTFSTTSRSSIDGSDKSTYRNSLSSTGLLAHLDYYCKSAGKAIKLLSLQIAKVLESPYNGAIQGSPMSRASGSIMSSAQSSQLVTQCQQAISQIGCLLALVSEYYTKVVAEYPSIKDHIFLDVRVSKQALYNNVAALVMAIQLATDPMAQVAVLEMTLEAIQTTERSVTDLTEATRNLAAESDDIEKHTRSRLLSDASLTSLDHSSFSGSQRQSELDTCFQDNESDMEGDTTRNSQRRSESRLSSFSSNTSLTVPSTPGTEYTSRTHSTNYPFPQITPISPVEVSPPALYRPTISMSQKTDARGAKLKKMLGDDAPTPTPASKVVEVPWYLGHDYAPSDISFNMEGHVKGGTLSALVERLTLHDGLDASFVATFLLTYRSFTTTKDFFALLFRRISITPPNGLSPAELTQWTDRKMTPIRLRVFNIIKSWLENFYLEDEAEDRQMLTKIKAFAESGHLRELMSFAAVQLIKLVEKRESSDGSFRKMVLNLSTQAPQPITPRNLKRIRFMDLDPLEFARQLTIMESNNYNRIKPIECLAKAWTSDDPEIAKKASNIKRMIETSNVYANWINEIVLSEPEVKKRVLIIRFLISVAEKLRQLNNFSMLSATTAALALSPVHRLKRTWELVPTKAMNSLAAVQAVTSSARSWYGYRQELHNANPPCVPFIGIYLTDLVMIEDGNPDFLKGAEHHINFYKRVGTAEVIREIQQYQSVPYCLTTVPEIQTFIRKGLEKSKSVNELHNMSLELEPREGEEEKITRLLAESGFL